MPVVQIYSDQISAPSTDHPVVPSSSSIPGIPVTVSPTPVSPPLRRSVRQTQKPAWLDDFISCTSNPSLLSPSNTAYTLFVASFFIITGRETAIGCKWVFKTKLRADGSVERYKGHLVAKGFTQIAGVDYNENFSPVAKTVTIRLFLAMAAAHSWPVHQMDVNNAFLHGYLDEDLYMIPPEGYSVSPGLVCKLGHSIYGLKQASRLTQSANDHCLFTKGTPNGLMALLVYVDDILVTAPSLADIRSVKDYLHSLFTIKDLGDARYFLGLEIARNSDGMYVAQTKYVQDIVRDTGMMNAKCTSTPFPLGLKLSENCGALLPNPEQYRRLVGRLLYLGFTRSDISYSVQQLSQFLTRPCDVHWKAVVHVVRYLKGSPSKGLFLPSQSSFELRAYCDADWASCSDSRRPLTGFCIFFGDALISWKTKKQSNISHSTAEAEYHSLAATVYELRWLSYVLSDFGISLFTPHVQPPHIHLGAGAIQLSSFQSFVTFVRHPVRDKSCCETKEISLCS
ncbi:UNVERIFIED_CONTAM: Retrovirus-related Pol polyprotein from transposon RE2 [Sesamum latifolium]|uniref:Retrovirus-related Pol polyprotein from transposon RE2 n=1 Tax=Sesamum latifolium TaxID=2727402 RepID=A0AAW2UKM8_9LAMI